MSTDPHHRAGKPPAPARSSAPPDPAADPADDDIPFDPFDEPGAAPAPVRAVSEEPPFGEPPFDPPPADAAPFDAAPFDDPPLDPFEPGDPFAPAGAFEPAPAAPPSRLLAALPEPPYLAALNPAQREAVEALDGPVLVLAGAGTGKTRVLTTRLAYLLHTRRAQPWQIMAVTFTNKAAKEMQERVAALVGGATEGMRLGTFHSIAARILRRDAERVGLKANFTILDTDDQIRLLKQILEAANIDTQRWPPRVLQGIIDRWKDKGLAPDKVQEDEVHSGGFADGRARLLYAAYQERLRSLNATDFGDLLLHNLTLFMDHPDVLAEYHRRVRYLLVDEYQDTNLAQYLWLRLLAQGHRNICCVGDDDQSIYGWRGAEIGNILKFEKDFPGARIVRLEQNYRSTPPILAAASHLIAHNRGRLGKTLWTEAGGGDKIRIRGVWDGETEARMVGEMIEDLHRAGHRLDQIAILMRAGFQTREFEERFIQLAIPYRVVGGPRFYERLEIRDALAYLRLVNQPDDDLAFERIVNKPKRGIGDTTVQALHQLGRAKRLSLAAAAQQAVQGTELKPAARKALAGFVAHLERWRALAPTVNHIALAEAILDESGYVAMWKADKTPEAPGRLDNLKELVRGMAEFDTLGGFLEHISLVMENTEQAGAERVSLMTLHSAKGLEFETVFLPGWEEGIFPHQRALDESGKAGLEEERRLAYVGITRARKRLVISFAANRRVYNQWQSAIPSRFIEELPRAHIEIDSDQGLYSGGWSRAGGAWPARPPAHGGLDDDRHRDRDHEHDDGGGEAHRGWRDAKGGLRAPVAQPYRPAPEDGAAAAAQEARARFEQARNRTLRRPDPPRLAGDDRDGVLVSNDPARARFKPGDRVFHQKFGYGLVRLADGDKITVKFDHSDEKKLVASFLKRG